MSEDLDRFRIELPPLDDYPYDFGVEVSDEQKFTFFLQQRERQLLQALRDRDDYKKSSEFAANECWETAGERDELKAALAAAQTDIDHLRSVISTPEVYVGVVTEECEKHWAALITAAREETKAIQEELKATRFLYSQYRQDARREFELNSETIDRLDSNLAVAIALLKDIGSNFADGTTLHSEGECAECDLFRRVYLFLNKEES